MTHLGTVRPGFDVERIRQDFPILSQSVRGKTLVFLDSAASAQKPVQVMDAMRVATETQYANVHRGLHWMSERTTDAFEGVRDKVAALLNAPSRDEVVFTRNSTEAINLVAFSHGGLLRPGQAVVISEMEHHANIVPWLMLRDRTGIELRVAKITDQGEIDMASLAAHLADGKVGLVAVTHMSNVLGTYTPWCIARSMCRRWMPISMCSPGTSCMGQPGSACCGLSGSCWRPCRP
jgi:cysteine desulfurase/selenocysteine lyase